MGNISLRNENICSEQYLRRSRAKIFQHTSQQLRNIPTFLVFFPYFLNKNTLHIICTSDRSNINTWFGEKQFNKVHDKDDQQSAKFFTQVCVFVGAFMCVHVLRSVVKGHKYYVMNTNYSAGISMTGLNIRFALCIWGLWSSIVV